MLEESVPFGAGADAVLDVASRIANTGIVVAPEVTQAARLVAHHLAALPPARARQAIEQVIL